MLLKYFDYEDKTWLYNGFKTTLDSYGKNTEQLLDDINWMRTLPLYYEDEHNIYVHAGINPDKPLDNHTEYELLWVREIYL